MLKRLTMLIFLIVCLHPKDVHCQLNENKIGAWYMYFWNTTIKESSWGFQGDMQYRSWNLAGDLEQLLLRGGVTYKPKNSNVKFTLGYGNVTTGKFESTEIASRESRVYQEALIPHHVGGRFFLTHRFRFEQRVVADQDLRTRFRYNLFLNIPLNKKTLEKGAVYLALYNELFINGQRGIGDDKTVELFDRNRTYWALGFCLAQGFRIQVGFMQQTTDNWKKQQIQLSMHHKF